MEQSLFPRSVQKPKHILIPQVPNFIRIENPVNFRQFSSWPCSLKCPYSERQLRNTSRSPPITALNPPISSQSLSPVALAAPGSSRLPAPWNSFFTAILDAPPDPSRLQAASSRVPTASRLSALEAPQQLLTTPSYRHIRTPATSPTSPLPPQSEPQSSCPGLWAQTSSPPVSSQHSSPGCSD